jgi:ADP-L-glycero-D-manno-heptose 6-epimerase
MIILTGGAGFIGSCFLWKLNQEGVDDIIVVDHLDHTDKWKNLRGKRIRDYIQKNDFLDMIENHKLPAPEYVIHMGACSSTTDTDANYYMKNNYEYSKVVAEWALSNEAYFMYASSAATYGDGGRGYKDEENALSELEPLNIYGYSKHLFDLWLSNKGLLDKVTGLKFFNVFGPNEYHKEDMRSVICKAFPVVKDEERIRLFKSYKSDYADGEQKRDFVYIKDVVDVMFQLMRNARIKGIFNLGTGKAESWNALAKAMFKALGKTPGIEYVDMPEPLRAKYQYFTQADISKLKNTGLNINFSPFEESVADYMKYLKDGSYL